MVATILLVAESATNAELLRADVKNARFECPGKDGFKVALRNGRGEGAPGELPSEFYLKQVVFGDLNGDGTRDAAAVLVRERGASGWFTVLAVLLGGEPPKCVASRWLGEGLPFGTVGVDSVKVDGSTISLVEEFFGPHDAHCCPSLRRRERLKLAGSSLVRVGRPEPLGAGVHRQRE